MSPISRLPIQRSRCIDEEHVVTHLRMLDANAKGADWREASEGPVEANQHDEQPIDFFGLSQN